MEEPQSEAGLLSHTSETFTARSTIRQLVRPGHKSIRKDDDVHGRYRSHPKSRRQQ